MEPTSANTSAGQPGPGCRPGLCVRQAGSDSACRQGHWGLKTPPTLCTTEQPTGCSCGLAAPSGHRIPRTPGESPRSLLPTCCGCTELAEAPLPAALQQSLPFVSLSLAPPETQELLALVRTSSLHTYDQHSTEEDPPRMEKWLPPSLPHKPAAGA